MVSFRRATYANKYTRCKIKVTAAEISAENCEEKSKANQKVGSMWAKLRPQAVVICIVISLSAEQCNSQRNGTPTTTAKSHLSTANGSGTSDINIISQRHTQSLYQNLSALTSTRPLDRPSLTLVDSTGSSSSSSKSNSNSNNNRGTTSSRQTKQASDGSTSDSNPGNSLEGSADWFMLGSDDLIPSESGRRSTVVDKRTGASKKSESSGGKRKSGGNRTSSSSSSSSSSSNKTSSGQSDDEQQSDSSDSNEIYDDIDDAASSTAGSTKEPECAANGRYYCTYKEEYPLKLVTEVTKYYKWPLEKLFRDLHAQIMPKLAQDSSGNLVCNSITRVVRPGWARNTNDRWLVVINTENYHQYVTEVVCQYGSNSRCNFIPPCYYSSCQQRYNTQKLLVIDPNNPYRGPFLSEFLFPSCCVCYVPSTSESIQDRYRTAPSTIYQRTMQQEAAVNLDPPQFRSTGLIEDVPGALLSGVEQRLDSTSSLQPSASNSLTASGTSKAASAGQPGEIRRRGEQLPASKSADESSSSSKQTTSFSDFPRLGLVDSLFNGHRTSIGDTLSAADSLRQ